jgi:cell division protein ZapE
LIIVELETKIDYRLIHSKTIKIVFHVNSKGCKNNFLQERFDELSSQGKMQPVSFFVRGRLVEFLNAHADILFTSFDELCNRPLGAIDYLAIAEKFKIILIADIPQLSSEVRDQGRRFVTLIDTLYEKKVKIMCTLDVPVDKLTLDDKEFDFKRTRSRLVEMKSEKYFYANQSAR